MFPVIELAAVADLAFNKGQVSYTGWLPAGFNWNECALTTNAVCRDISCFPHHPPLARPTIVCCRFAPLVSIQACICSR